MAGYAAGSNSKRDKTQTAAPFRARPVVGGHDLLVGGSHRDDLGRSLLRNGRQLSSRLLLLVLGLVLWEGLSALLNALLDLRQWWDPTSSSQAAARSQQLPIPARHQTAFGQRQADRSQASRLLRWLWQVVLQLSKEHGKTRHFFAVFFIF